VKEKGTGKILIYEPTNQVEVIKRLNNEIRYALQLLSWLCPDTLEHYKATKSYQGYYTWHQMMGLGNFRTDVKKADQ
jgi:hypothetical protein